MMNPDKPPTMDWSASDLVDSYKMFKQRMELYFVVKNTKDDKKVPTILLASGEEGLRRYNSWELTAEERKDPDVIFERFLTQLEPAENFRISRLKLSGFRQKPDEKLDDFVGRCRLLAKRCDFRPDELNERIVELIIANTPIPDFQKELLNKPKAFTLEEAITLGRSYEASNAHLAALKNIDPQPTTSVDAFKSTPRKSRTQCRNCGLDHKHGKDNCPAKDDICHACEKLGHWQKLCITTKYRQNRSQSTRRPQSRGNFRPRGRGNRGRGNRGRGKTRQLDSLQFTHDTDNYDRQLTQQFESFSFDSINDNSNAERTEAYATLQIKLDNKPGVHNLTVKVDSGAESNTLPFRTYRKMFPERLDSEGNPVKSYLTPPSKELTAYNDGQIRCAGVTTIQARFHGQWHDFPAYVVDVRGPAIIGMPSSLALKLITLHCAVNVTSPKPETTNSKINTVTELMTQYPQQFDRIGEFKTVHKLEVDPNFPPHVDRQRIVPISLKDPLKAELDKMANWNVIRPITEPTSWVSSITCVTKQDGSLRICLDPRYLNQALIRPHHQTPTLTNINHKLNGAKFFSKLDAKSGYWSVKLHPDSQKLTTFQTPFGRYCFTRLPFGLSVSQDIFQLEMDRILAQCEGTCGIADDIIVYGTTEEEHDRNLKNLMEVAQREGLVFNSSKCYIKKDSVSFFGNVYTSQGMKPDSAKIQDLRSMPEPTNKAEVQQFLGFVTYLSQFIKDFSTKTAVLRDLVKKDSHFVWEPHHQQAFDNLKTEVSESSRLLYYNPKKPVELHCDASLRGLGAALLQADDNNVMRPVAFASKSLTSTEQRYACIERELLAIVFGTKRFHTYLYGRHFTVITDHRPLVMIHEKPITSAPPRLQRMLISLNGYNFKLVHKPGAENQLADALSRLPSPDNAAVMKLDIRVDFVQFSPERKNEILDQTNCDPTLNYLKNVIVNGWPDKMTSLPSDTRPFWHFRDQLSVENGIVMKGQQIVIPAAMKTKILAQLHTAHMGLDKTKLLARQTVFWNQMNNDIEHMVRTCTVCQQHQKSQQPEPLLQHEVPSRPWSVIATDLFELDQAQYLIIADYYSKYLLVRKLPTPSPSSIVIKIMKQVFAEFGIPDKVISDNGPHYASQVFRDFSREWMFEHVTTSPRRPQGNGFIERQVQTTKNLLKKAHQSNTDFDLTLLHWRSTPIASRLPSPAELLMGRKVRTTLPVRCDVSHTVVDPDATSDELRRRQEKQKSYFDRHASNKDLKRLIPGQQVLVQDNTKLWHPAVVESEVSDRSYVVRDGNGKSFRRNRQSIRELPTFTTPPPAPCSEPGPSPVKKVTFADQSYQTRSGRHVRIPARFCDN